MCIHLHSVHVIFHGVITNHNYVKKNGSSARKKISYTQKKIAEVICGNHEVVTSSSNEGGKLIVALLFTLNNKVMSDLWVSDARISAW